RGDGACPVHALLRAVFAGGPGRLRGVARMAGRAAPGGAAMLGGGPGGAGGGVPALASGAVAARGAPPRRGRPGVAGPRRGGAVRVGAVGDLARTLGVGLAAEPALVVASLAFAPALAVGLWAVARRPPTLALLVCYALVPLGLALLAAYPLHAFRERGFIAVAFVPQVLAAAGLDALAALGAAPLGGVELALV